MDKLRPKHAHERFESKQWREYIKRYIDDLQAKQDISDLVYNHNCKLRKLRDSGKI